MSLQTKLLAWLCIPLTALWCSGMVAAYLLTQRMVGLAFDQNLLAMALTVSNQIEGNDRDGKPHLKFSANDERMLLFDPVDEIRYAVLDEDGREVAGEPDVPLPRAMMVTGKPVFYDAPLRRQPMRWAALVAEQKDEDDPKPTRATIIVGETLGKREAVSRQTLYLTTLPQIGLVALLGALVWFAVRRGLRPLHELRTRVQQRSEADLHPITVDGKSREIDALRDALNGFMVRLDGALAMQSEFVGNAAHQLRTPLAAVKARIDYAGRKHAQAEETIAEVRPSVDRCVRLVNQLLALAQVDAGHPRALATERVDVVCQARELVGEMTGAALAKHIDLGVEATTDPLYVVTNPTLLAELLRNVVDNALCYTPPRGRVTVRLEHTSEHVTILVCDNGPGIAEHDKAHVFERFYRGRDAPGTGSGLGLCIAQRCAAVLGAEVDLVPSNVGACFVVTLARETPPAFRGA